MKTILLTGATDGIGFATAKLLRKQGHDVLLHGRNSKKLEHACDQLEKVANDNKIKTYQADLSSLAETRQLAINVQENHQTIDVLINNAGVYKTPQTTTEYGVDIRFIVNTIAPYQLTLDLLPIMPSKGRVVNLSSAAQTPLNLCETFNTQLNDDMAAYAQSKLAIIMWTRHLAHLSNIEPAIIAVNPGSLLASKMVKEGFGVAGKDISIGAKIIEQLAIEDKYDKDSGKYFDNDIGKFAPPHVAGLNDADCTRLVSMIDDFLANHSTIPL